MMMNVNMITYENNLVNDEDDDTFLYFNIQNLHFVFEIKKNYLRLDVSCFSSFSVNKLLLQSFQQISVLTIPIIHIGTK